MTENADLSNQDKLLLETQKKSSTTAYLLWFFLGSLGIHYFYLGNKKKALWRLIPTVLVIGSPIVLVLIIIDLFTLGKEVEQYNEDLLQRLSQDKGQS